MAELLDRIEREAELAKKLSKVASKHRAELQLLLMALDDARTQEETDKAESDLREFWERVEKETRSAIMVPIANTWFAAALLHGMEPGRALEQSGIHAAAHSATVAKQYTETSKRRVTDSIDRLKKQRDEEHAKDKAELQKKIDNARKQVNRQQELPKETTHQAVMKELEKLEARNKALEPGQVLNKEKARDISVKVFGPNRVTGVAETEIPRAQNRGAGTAIANSGKRLIAYWAHSDLRPKGHANALKDPCETCSPLEGKPWWEWGNKRPGEAHSRCDCFARIFDPATGEFLSPDPSPRGLDEWAKRFGITSNPSPLGTLRAESAEWDYVGHLLLEQAADLPAANAITVQPDVHQKTRGTYRKGKFLLHGLQIQIETPAGATRSGVAPNGDKWSVVMPWSYGEITSLEDSQADGDPMDVFIGPCPEIELAFVVDQNKQDGSFDEHKLLLGFHSTAEARQAYHDSFSPGWAGFRAITPLTIPELVAWIKSRQTGKPIGESLLEGGPGSGDFNHAGRPGEIGGSAPGEVAKFEATPWEAPRGDVAVRAPIGPDGNVVEGKIAGFPITTYERGLIGKVSKKTKAALEKALSKPEVVDALHDAGIKNLRLEAKSGANKPKNWTMAKTQDGALMFHPKTFEQIDSSEIPERKIHGIERVIHHEAGHGLWSHASEEKKRAFIAAIDKHPEVRDQIAKIVNIRVPPGAWNDDAKERAANESHAELNAMRKYDPARYAAMPDAVKTAADAISGPDAPRFRVPSHLKNIGQPKWQGQESVNAISATFNPCCELLEDWDESKHPRDDKGKFVSSGAIHAAAKDPKAAKQLRSEVTDPEQRKRLDDAIAHAQAGGTIKEPHEQSAISKALDTAKHAVSAVASIPDKIAGAIDSSGEAVIKASRKLPGQVGVHDEPHGGKSPDDIQAKLDSIPKSLRTPTDAQQPYLDDWMIGTQQEKSRDLFNAAEVKFAGVKSKPNPSAKRALDGIYSRTQKALEAAGIDHVTLYRGMEDLHGVEPGERELATRALNSWSLDRKAAEAHAHGEGGRILKATFPRQAIVGFYGTGMGSVPGREFVVSGGPSMKFDVSLPGDGRK